MLFSICCRCVALLSHGLPVRKIVEAGPEFKNLSPSISATLLHISFLADSCVCVCVSVFVIEIVLVDSLSVLV